MDATTQNQFLIIIGAAKCGTTSLFDYLSSHPAVCPSVPKETGFFTEYQKKDVHWKYQDVRAYTEFWPGFDPAVHRYRLEASTGYTRWPVETGVAERMSTYGVRPRLIYLVRDPIERIESDVNRRRIVNHKPFAFEDSFFIDLSRYARQLDPYIETFGRESIRVVDFAHLRSDPNQVCAELYDWLELKPCMIANPGISNETMGVKRSQLERLMVSNRALHRATQTLPLVVRQQIKKLARKWAPYRHQPVRVSPDRALEIREHLQGDASRLSQEWGVDITPWGFGTANGP